MKLTSQYNRNIIPAIILIFLGSTISSYFLIRNVLQNEVDKAIIRTRGRVEYFVKQNHRIPVINTFDDLVIRFEPATPASDSGFSSATQFIPEQNKQHLSRQLVFNLADNNQNWRVTISQPLEGTKHLTIAVAEVAITTITLTLLLLLMMNRLVLSRIWRPFYWSLDLIKRFKVDDPENLVFPDSHIEEFQLMNSHFFKAAVNANRDYRNLKEFSENASHEIQTPLAIMRSNLDLLAQENMTEKQSELLQSVYSAMRKMTRLQESLLLLTKIDNRQFQPVSDIRIDLVLQDKHQQIQELFHMKNLSFNMSLTETCIPANKELLDILLNNLFSNAIRHNVANGEIQTKLDKNSLTVSNTGINAPLDPSRIFRRFYKNSRQSENNGLGLSIIKQICDTTALNLQYEFDNGRHSFTIGW